MGAPSWEGPGRSTSQLTLSIDSDFLNPGRGGLPQSVDGLQMELVDDGVVDGTLIAWEVGVPGELELELSSCLQYWKQKYRSQ